MKFLTVYFRNGDTFAAYCDSLKYEHGKLILYIAGLQHRMFLGVTGFKSH